MKKFIVLTLVCILAGFASIACQRDQGVHAGNDSDYKPRPAPSNQDGVSKDVKGELIRVDMPAKTVAIRVENGMVQTFKFDDNTMLLGLAAPKAPASGKTRDGNTAMRNLAGKEGSELTVQWRDDNGAKMATVIEITQVSTSNNTRRSGRKH